LINEADVAKRHGLDQRRLLVTAAQNGLRQERWDVLNACTGELGFESYVALCESLGHLNLERLRVTMERFLWDTERRYRDHLAEELRGIDVDPALAERSDLQRLFRSPGFDDVFPVGSMLPALEATLRGLHVDHARQAYIHLDTEERPRKTPRAFCAPPQIPQEVYLVISPHGGHDDYRALFHEGGHAQHFAHIDAELPFAYRGLGDNSVTEGFAFLLEHLLYSPRWLEEHLGLTDSDSYLLMARFHKLYFLRRYAAKLLYELELHADGDTRSKGKRYADLLTAHVGVRYAPEDYLSDVDDGFYCARYIRAWMFEAQLRSVLTHRWGERWFANAEAGALVRELWSHGQRYAADELLQQMGEREIEIGPLAADVAI
jgi:hypothetical protein